jgi:hypothetical protein
MPIKIKCPKCQQTLTANDNLAGKRANCPKCKNPLTIPAASSASAPAGPRIQGSNGTAPSKPPAKPAPSHEDLENLAASLLSDEPKEGEKKQLDYVETTCPWCDELVKFDLALAGKQAQCPNPECKRIVKVPVPKDPSQRDWRATDARPAAARRDTDPAPEGAWGSTNKSVVSGDALRDAGVLPSKRPGLSRNQKISRMVSAAVGVILLGVGVVFALNWLGGKKQDKILAKALASVTGRDATTKAPEAGVVNLAAGRYHLARREPNSARPEKSGNNAALPQFALARGHFSADPKNAGGDAALADLLLTELNLAGGPKLVEDRARLSWRDTTQELVRTVQAVRDPRARADAVIQVTRKLTEMGEPGVIDDLMKLIGDGPNSPAVIGLEYLRADNKEAAKRVLGQVMSAYAKQAAPLPGIKLPSTVKLPPVTVEVVALAHAFGEEQKLPKVTEQGQLSVESIGKAVGLALQRGVGAGVQEAGKLDVPAQIEALTDIADLAQGEDAKKTAEEAVKVLTGKLGNKKIDGWVLVRLGRVAQAVGLDEETLLAIANRNRDPNLRAWGQYQVFRTRLAGTSGKAEESMLDVVEAGTIAAGLARVDLATHNTKQDKDYADKIEDWKENQRGFGYVGVALGLQK